MSIKQNGGTHYVVLVHPQATVDLNMVRDKRVIITGVFVENITEITEAASHLTFFDQHEASMLYYENHKAEVDSLISAGKFLFYVDTNQEVSGASITWNY